MKSLAQALDGAIPRFQQFRMCHSQVAATNDFGLLIFGQFTRVIAEQFSPVLLEPHCQTLSFLWSQPKYRAFELFQAHSFEVYRQHFIASTL